MKKVILRIVLYLAMVVLVVGGSGVLGYIAEQKAYWYAFALAAAFLIEQRFIGKDGKQMASQK